MPTEQNEELLIMAKIVGKGHKTWKDGAVMNYTITDDGVLSISGTLPLEDFVDIRSTQVKQ